MYLMIVPDQFKFVKNPLMFYISNQVFQGWSYLFKSE